MKKKFITGLFAALLCWIAIDLWWPLKVNLRQFDPIATAKLDQEMWRSYYEKKPLTLFNQSARLMRTQLQAPFWRSWVMAFQAAKAAFVFKDGKSRADYNKALPALEKYYGQVNRLSSQPFDVKQAAQKELEWWIIRRERQQYPPETWTRLQAEVAGLLYGLPPARFDGYARLRTEAMVFRDEKGEQILEEDWENIRYTLEKGWANLKDSLR